MGWNDVEVVRADPLFTSLPAKPSFYFVHGYFFEPSDKDNISSVCDYGFKFAEACRKEMCSVCNFILKKARRMACTCFQTSAII